MNRDPIGYSGGYNNLFVYVGNAPLQARDPLGLMGWGDVYWHIHAPAKPAPFSDCQKSLDAFIAANPLLNNLANCSKNAGCIDGGIKCWQLGEVKGVYRCYERVSYSSDCIRIDVEHVSRQGELTKTILEELYHSLTICAQKDGIWDTRPVPGAFDNFGGAGLSDKDKQCAKCFAEEMAAKLCRDRQLGNPNPDPSFLFGESRPSCGKECAHIDWNSMTGNEERNHPVTKAAIAWFNKNAAKLCDSVDKKCQTQAPKIGN